MAPTTGSSDREGSSADVAPALADGSSGNRVFGAPVLRGKTILVPTAHVRAGGHPRLWCGDEGARADGAGFVARPVGAWSIGEGGCVSWHPAVNVNRIVWGGQLALAAVVTAVAFVLARRRGIRPRGGGGSVGTRAHLGRL